MDNARHAEYTGVSNIGILDNYRLLFESGKDIMVRIPVIPGFNDDHDHIERLRQFILTTKNKSLKRICLLPYHKIGSSKYKRFNIPYLMDDVEQPSSQRMLELKEYFSCSEVSVKIG